MNNASFNAFRSVKASFYLRCERDLRLPLVSVLHMWFTCSTAATLEGSSGLG